ncbi:NADP-dependent oxidoreductase [Antrihabitans sp. YC3-6]|uniref:NADP-dependent oxidoreductase n=1 Tax=Antrihabitans stalagmiti TaxID=2799499 RepID=A0A934NPK0_9NOCA|nr:NADP-dependent oxidoreductase [Antrihabitans stalagmiti]MBJ8338915.1 NADP-dependent oxidoreductase [Antrihabitans stalagmiti]
MRAAIVTTPGDPDAIDILDVPEPEPAAGQVRIEVAAATINPVDALVRQGFAPNLSLPLGLGWDVAGTIDAVGAGVTGFAIGTPVVGIEDSMYTPVGPQAEYIVLATENIAPAPTSVTATEAATLPLNGLTAWQALDLLALTAGATLLVTGAAGAVGGYAIELATARGLRVIATASAEDESAVRGFGANEFIARTDELVDAVRTLVPGGVDAVLDAALLGSAAIGAVRDGGRFAALTPPSTPASERGIDVQTVQVVANGTQLAALVALVDDGTLTLRVAETYALEELRTAHKRLAEGGVRGRMVVNP